MGKSITDRQLKKLVDSLNDLAGTPTVTYSHVGTGGFKPNALNYHLDWAYGGVALHQVVREGGIRDVLETGHIKKRELYYRIKAYKCAVWDFVGSTRVDNHPVEETSLGLSNEQVST